MRDPAPTAGKDRLKPLMGIQLNAGISPAMDASSAVRRSAVRMVAARAWTRAWSHPALIRFVAGLFPGTRRPPSNPGPFDASTVRRILVARTDGIGDMVLTLPLLQELRRVFPEAKIILATNGKNGELIKGTRLVDEIVDQGPKTQGIWGRAWRWIRWGNVCRKICSGGAPDLAVFPRWGMDLDYASAIGHLSGARWRLGYSEQTEPRKALAQSGYDTLLTHCHREAADHEIRTNLNILRGLGIEPKMSRALLELNREEIAGAAAWLEERGLQDVPVLVALGVGANEPKRRSPSEVFAKVATELASRASARFIIVGGPQEAGEAEELCKALSGLCFDATRGLSLRETAALLSHCNLYLGNNSGPMHIAAAVDIPVVYISCHSLAGADTDSNSDFRFAPAGVAYTCLRPARPLPGCSGDCDAPAPHCILQVTAEDVLLAALHAIQGEFAHGPVF